MDDHHSHDNGLTATIEPGITIHVRPSIDGTGNYDDYDSLAVHFLSEAEAEDKWTETATGIDNVAIELPCPHDDCDSLLGGLQIPLFAVQTAFCTNVKHMVTVECKRGIRIQK